MIVKHKLKCMSMVSFTRGGEEGFDFVDVVTYCSDGQHGGLLHTIWHGRLLSNGV